MKSNINGNLVTVTFTAPNQPQEKWLGYPDDISKPDSSASNVIQFPKKPEKPTVSFFRVVGRIDQIPDGRYGIMYVVLRDKNYLGGEPKTQKLEEDRALYDNLEDATIIISQISDAIEQGVYYNE